MPKYKYSSRKADGKTENGVRYADSEQGLFNLLQAEGQYMVSCSEVEKRIFKGKIPITILADFCLELSTMLRAGISLVRGLTIMVDDPTLKPKFKMLYNELITAICAGTPFSDALEEHEAAFPVLLTSTVRSAETTGKLDVAMQRMGDYFERQSKLKKKISSLLMYPKILATLVVVVVIFLLLVIVPRFQTIFEMLETLPWPTKALLGIYEFVKSNLVPLALGIFIVIFAFHFIKQIPKVRYTLDKLKVKLPIFGKLQSTIYTSRFASTLSSLYSSGVSITTTLQVAKDTIGNSYVEAQFDKLLDDVRAGESLSACVSKVDGFDKKLGAMMTIGEESGNLDEVLDVLVARFEQEAEMSTEKMVSLIEPMMLILMAVIVLFIMLAVMLPIFELYSSIEQASY